MSEFVLMVTNTSNQVNIHKYSQFLFFVLQPSDQHGQCKDLFYCKWTLQWSTGVSRCLFQFRGPWDSTPIAYQPKPPIWAVSLHEAVTFPWRYEPYLFFIQKDTCIPCTFRIANTFCPPATVHSEAQFNQRALILKNNMLQKCLYLPQSPLPQQTFLL